MRFLFAPALFASLAVAQTFTDCNPLNKTCPADPALGTSHTFNLTSNSLGDTWNTTAGTVDYSNNQGGRFTIAKKGDSPTVKSDFYIFFGEVHVVMKAAKGQGIVSSIVLESDDLDEIDWEFLGGNNTVVETNYFGKGNTTAYDRAIYYPVATPTDSFHEYSVKWTKAAVQWLIDGTVVRTLAYADANGGSNFPQTPMNVRLGIWAGGDPSEPKGTIEWAQGETDYSKVPFTMVVQSVNVIDYSGGDAPVANSTTTSPAASSTSRPAKRADASPAPSATADTTEPAKSYAYSDHSGSYASIRVERGNSTAAQTIASNAASGETLHQRWDGLSSAAKIGIAVGVLGALAVALIAFIAWACVQRRKGRAEALVKEREWSAENVELINQQKQWGETYGGHRVFAEKGGYAPAGPPQGFR